MTCVRDGPSEVRIAGTGEIRSVFRVRCYEKKDGGSEIVSAEPQGKGCGMLPPNDRRRVLSP